MNYIGIQIICFPFALAMIYVSYIHYKKGVISASNLFLWGSLWISFMTFVAFPVLLNPIVQSLKFFRVLDLLMVIAFMILVMISYSNLVKQSYLDSQLDKLIRKMTTIKKPIQSKRKNETKS